MQPSTRGTRATNDAGGKSQLPLPLPVVSGSQTGYDGVPRPSLH